jgi:hypothetical protein
LIWKCLCHALSCAKDRHSVTVSRVDVSAGPQQQLDHLRLVAHDGNVQQRWMAAEGQLPQLPGAIVGAEPPRSRRRGCAEQAGSRVHVTMYDSVCKIIVQ